uniref:Uncharacterized protein n=1 Tax=Glossina brevipalpis TaxID=37001 RepID=A0A1A9X035_9MUSC
MHNNVKRFLKKRGNYSRHMFCIPIQLSLNNKVYLVQISMDDYVKRLSLGSSVKDVLEPCAKLLHWLSMISNQGYDCKDMETIIKALVFIHECIIRFGNNIVDDLVEQEPFLKAYFERHLNNYRNLNCISSLKEDILQSSNILKNAVILDNLLKNVKDIYSEQMDVKSPKRLPLENKRTKMNLIANRLFQLPPSQIDAAFDKICCEIGFDVLGFIFCVNMDNSMIRQYCILEDKLCNKIINLNSNSGEQSIIECRLTYTSLASVKIASAGGPDMKYI